MADDFELKIEITGEKSVVESISRAISRDKSDEAKVSAARPERDEGKQAFGIADLTTVVMVVKGAYYLGKLADYIVEKLRQNKNKITILTAFGSVEITYKEELTMPIRLRQTPTRCRVDPFSGIELGIGRRLDAAGNAEQ